MLMKCLSGNLILSELYCKNIQVEEPCNQSLEILRYHGDITLIISRKFTRIIRNSVVYVSVSH